MNERLIDLLVEFDEMGFAPTIPCEDIEGAAKVWREKLIKEIEALEAENAALRDAAEYMIEAGGIDCCARCIFAENGTEENHYDCGRSGECLEGMIRFAKRSRGGGNG